MYVKACPTHLIQPGDDLLATLDRFLPPLQEGSIVVVTSKILSLSENRLVPYDAISKRDLIRREADAYLDLESPYTLTIKNNILIPASGIDESNTQWGYILYPTNAQKSAEEIWHFLRTKRNLSQLGIIISDSHTSPMRLGVTGIALSWCGFAPHYSYIGKPDLFERPLKVTVVNLLDALASAAVLAMGEGAECTPLAIIEQPPKVSFLNCPPSPEELVSVTISPDTDIYGPLLKAMPWQHTC